MIRTSGLVVLIVGACAWIGCARTQQARRVETTGFLEDYSQLKQGKKGEALRIYINPETDFSAYENVLLDDVTIWRAADSNLDDVPAKDIQDLALGLHQALVESLEDDYRIVHVPEPGTLRIRVAITEAAKSWVVMDTITTVVPHAWILSGVQKLATGTHSFVGRASIEGEILDAMSGERLAAAVDSRVGGRSFSGVMDSWDDVQQACSYWATRLRDRLRELRGKAKADGVGSGQQPQ